MVDQSTKQRIADLLKDLEEKINNMGIPFAEGLTREIADLRRLLTEKRSPRFALVGRRGAGKSSLLNAIFGEQIARVGHEGAMTGEASWWDYNGQRGTLRVLDTRGVQEGSEPDEKDEAETAEESIKCALGEQRADAILFLVKATEVDAAIDGDIEALADISGWLEETYGHRAPIVAVATHCDVLEPKKVELHNPAGFPKRDIDEKRRRVTRITGDLKEKLRSCDELNDQLADPLGVSSYMSWRDDGTLRTDDRWQIDRLTQFLIDELPDQAKFEMARLSQVRFLQRRLANRIVNSCGVICAGIAFTPIPLADIAPITGLQTTMVIAIGYLGGRELDTKSAAEFLGAMGVNAAAGFAFREATRALVQLIPVAGSAVSAAVAYAATYALGKAAIAYFIGGADEEKAREIFKKEQGSGEERYENIDLPAVVGETG